jgi:hypothetical protein
VFEHGGSIGAGIIDAISGYGCGKPVTHSKIVPFGYGLPALSSYERVRREVVIDFDAANDPVTAANPSGTDTFAGFSGVLRFISNAAVNKVFLIRINCNTSF